MKYHRMFGRRGVEPLMLSSDASEVLVYGEIGWEVQGAEFVKTMKALSGKDVVVRINSPGGNVFEGLVMANAIKDHNAKVSVVVDGLAASIASIIAIAAPSVRMADNAFFMIHEPFTFAGGTAEDFKKIAALLEKMTGTFTSAYMARSGADEDTVKTWMREETWFTAAEAIEAGFADAVEEGTEVEADFDLSVFSHVPDQLKKMAASDAPTVRKVERALRDAGFSRVDSRKLAASVRDAQHTRRDAESQDEQQSIALVRSLAASIRPTH